MKIRIGKAINSVAKKAQENPGVAVAVLGLLFPHVARKIAPIVVAAATKPDA
jgi:hypothetical protein